MKRIIVSLLALLLLCGCSAGAPAVTEAQETDAQETEAPAKKDAGRLTSVSVGDGKAYLIFESGALETIDSSGIETAHANAAAIGYVKSVQALARDSVALVEALEGYSEVELKNEVIAKMLNNYYTYFFVSGETRKIDTEVVESLGYHSEKGVSSPNSPTQTYRYTQQIEVEEGETFYLLSGGNKLGMRFLTAYENGVARPDRSYIDTGCNTTEYVIPAGVTHVVATFRYTGSPVVAVCEKKVGAEPSLRSGVDISDVAALSFGEAEPAPMLFGYAKTLDNDYLNLEENHVMHNKTLAFSFNIDGLSGSQAVRMGHGETAYGGSYIEITASGVKGYYRSTADEERLSVSHGLDISGRVSVKIESGIGRATVTVETEKGSYTTPEFEWGGRNGKIFARSVGVKVTEAELEWNCSDFARDIWLMGDSYFNTQSNQRWPYYLNRDGYTDYFMAGFPGRNTKSALEDFKRALRFGTPEIAVWCMGMNDADGASINANYKAATDEFLAICDERGITPVLATIPNTPTNLNVYKNEYVKASGRRYIDFSSAVAGNQPQSPWANGMLAGDKVHPAAAGAEALYNQLLRDFPEIKR